MMAESLREIDTSSAGTGDSFVSRSGSPAGDWSRMIVKVPGVRNCDGTGDLPSNCMNVVKGASGDVCGVAFGEALLCIATSGAVQAVVHMMTGFRQDCIRVRRPQPSAFKVFLSDWSRLVSLAICSGNRILATAILPRRTAHNFLKSFGESACGFVAERPRDFRDGIAGIRQSIAR